jgi:hypothetical protein
VTWNAKKDMNLRLQSNVRGSARKRLIVVIAVAGVLLIGLFIATKVVKKGPHTPLSVADTFVQYFVNDEAAKSYALYSPEGQKADSLQSWTTKVDHVKGFYSKEVLKKTTIAAPQTIFIYQATGKDGLYIFYVNIVKDIKGNDRVISFNAVPGVYSESTK